MKCRKCSKTFLLQESIPYCFPPGSPLPPVAPFVLAGMVLFVAGILALFTLTAVALAMVFVAALLGLFGLWNFLCWWVLSLPPGSKPRRIGYTFVQAGWPGQSSGYIPADVEGVRAAVCPDCGTPNPVRPWSG